MDELGRQQIRIADHGEEPQFRWGLIPIWKLHSGKADGVSSQRTSGSLFRITGTLSRQPGPVMPRSSLDLENPLPTHSGKKHHEGGPYQANGSPPLCRTHLVLAKARCP